MKYKVLALIVISCLLFVMAGGCTGLSTVSQGEAEGQAGFKTITPGVLKIATGKTNGPFVWVNTSDPDPQRRFVGFEADLMREIAKELNHSVEFTDQPFSTIITAVQAKQYDGSIDSFTITGERQERVDFSDPYYEAQQAILVRENDTTINNASDLVAKNKIICVGLGTTGEQAAKGLPGVKQENIRSYQYFADMLAELQLGGVDAIIMDYPISQFYCDQHPGTFKFTGELFPTKEPYGIVVNKENPGLTAAINKAMARIKADGRYDALLKKYNLAQSGTQAGGFDTIDEGKLKVATGGSNRMFHYINTSDPDPQRRFTGLEADLMREIARELNCSIEFVDHPFSAMITAIQAKQFDCAINTFSITGERQTRVDFTDPYYMIQQAIVVRAGDGSVTGASDLVTKNKKIGVADTSTGKETAEKLPGVNPGNVMVYAHLQDLFPELQMGSVDAVIVDYPVARYQADTYPEVFKLTGELFPTREPYAIVVNKENPGLTAAINKALANIMADGRYDALLKKYSLDRSLS